MTGSTATTVRDLRRSNRSRALWQVFLSGPLTRQEIGAQAGLSPATVSNLVADLAGEGVIGEVGLEDSNGGRPRGLLQVNPDYGYVIGVDVGETAFLVELFDLGLRLRARHRSVSDTTDPADAVAHIAAGIKSVIEQAGVASRSVLGIGVAAPGLVERGNVEPGLAEQGAVVHGQSAGWDAVPLERMLRDLVALPVLVDNGANTLGQAEKWFGAARGTGDAIIILLGLGVGTCVVSNGQVYRGATSSAGEWGHTAIVAGGRTCRCGAKGCLEAYVGAAALAGRYAELGGEPAATLEETIARLLVSGAPAAGQVRQELVSYLGVGIANLVNLFNPERVVVGGWLGQALCQAAGEPAPGQPAPGGLLGEITEAARAQALRLPFSGVAIVPAELGQDAVALGGATLPIARLLNAGAMAPAAQTRPDRRPAVPVP
jgi:predicted NBD/HSP70 family sugar kinase